MFEYIEPVFRPPSEAYSLILQPTIGCSWNKCSFCEMYTSKSFKVRNIDEVVEEIRSLSEHSSRINKVFLADGNAFCLSTNKLQKILKAINQYLPKVRRISSYALPTDIIRKSDDELKEIREAGLSLLYVGIETGDDELLEMINKGETYKSTVQGLVKAQESDIQNSVMIINGLGGEKYSNQHAVNSARIINEIKPYYLSTLVLSFPFGEEQYKDRFNGKFVPLNQIDLFNELREFISRLELEQTIFRSDHASNYLVLKGNLPRDKQRFLDELDEVINNPSPNSLRPEWMRGL